MSFTAKDWRDATTYAGGGDISTPVTASTLEDLETRLAAYTDLRADRVALDVREYGALGDTSDDLDAFETAIADLPDEGGTLLVPPGDYWLSGPISFNDTRSVTLAGAGGVTGGAQPASRLVFTATGAAEQLTARSSAGFTMRDLVVLYSSSSFTGDLIALGQSAEANDSSYTTFDRCYIGGWGVRTAAALLTLDKAIIGKFRDCVFWGAAVGVRGRNDPDNYSVRHTFDNCTFGGNTVVHVAVPNEAWAFFGCTFEQTVDAAGVNVGQVCLSNFGLPDYLSRGLVIHGCWFGDGTNAGNVIDVQGYGIHITGNRICNGQVGVRLGGEAPAEGVVVAGNEFDFVDYGIIVQSHGAVGATLQPNHYSNIGVTNVLYVGATKSGYADILGTQIASAATITIPDVPVVGITGSANITQINLGGNGQEVTLVFLGTASGTGLTKGGFLEINSNFVYTPSDTITLVQYSGTWYEKGRSVN